MYYADKQDPARALQLFQMGVRLGDPDSMVSLALMIDWGLFTPPNPSEVRLALLKKAADLGHSGALEQYSSGAEKNPMQQISEQKIQQMMFGLFSNFLQYVR